MLTESLIAAVSNPGKSTNNTLTKDAGIFIHEYQPLATLRTSFKKSSINANCLAANASHIFAAQAGKAIVHVYSRDRGNQEAIVPFPEQITSLSLVGNYDNAGILALGTEGGRLMLWELCTGRLVSTPQSHLQAVTCMVVDPTKNFLLTGSPDSNIHLWSIPALLSFSSTATTGTGEPSPYSPTRTLSKHRAPVSALATAHSHSSVNFAVSGSKDNTCIVWDYLNGTILHTFLLPTTPLCLALDPADRAIYSGYEDGSIQLIDLYKDHAVIHTIHDPSLSATPTQPPSRDQWPIPAGSTSSALSLTLSYDGTALLSGHENGKVHTWNIPKGKYNKHLADFGGPVTNLHMLPPIGFLNQRKAPYQIIYVVKPRHESSLTGNSNLAPASNALVPENYTFTAQFTTFLPQLSSSSVSPFDPMADFDAALTHPSFPVDILEEGITVLTSSSLNDDKPPVSASALQKENAMLKAQIAHARAAQQAHAENALVLGNEITRRNTLEKAKKRGKMLRRLRIAREEEVKRKIFMGELVEESNAETVEEQGEDGMDLSSDTEEFI